MSLAIQISDLVFAYDGRLVLDGVSFSVERGDMVGILGPNGSGKTTLLRILAAILVGEGDVKLKGKAILSYARRDLSRFLAVVPQESQVNFPYTVAEIVLMGRASHHNSLALEAERDLEAARKSMEMTETLSLTK